MGDGPSPGDGGVDAAHAPDVGVIADGGVDAGRPPDWTRPDAGPDDPPAPPPEGTRAIALAAGGDHVCALSDVGDVYCWGLNGTGQCAHGAGITVGTPTRVRGLPPIASLDTASSHTCAVGRDGSLWCWGFSYYGQLGVPDEAIGECGGAECSRVPLRVDIGPVDAVFTGNHGTCARGTDSIVRCWGRDAAVRAASGAELGSVSDLDLGQLHGCALGPDDRLRCFGETAFGRIGDGDRGDGVVPLDRVRSFEVGDAHACAIDGEDRVWCWGYNWSGALGSKGELPDCIHGDTGGECAIEPVEPTSAPLAGAVSVGEHRTCALSLEGRVACWGAWTIAGSTVWCGGSLGECDHIVTPVDGLEEPVAIEVGGSVACALEATGAVRCWGWNATRQLGDGSIGSEPVVDPVRVIGFGE